MSKNPSEPKGDKLVEHKSREVVESYIYATMRFNSSAYVNRLMSCFAEMAQCHLKGLEFKDGTDIGKVEVGPWGDATLEIPVRWILHGDNDKNHNHAKETIRALMGQFIEYEDDKVYKATHILNDVDVNKVGGMMYIRVNRNIWAALLDFSKGFRKYDSELSQRLSGKYSFRFYQIMSLQTEPITYSMETLRAMFLGKDSKLYLKSGDFVKSVIEASKAELDAVAPYSFDFVKNKSKNSPQNKGKRGTPSITSVTFYPKQMSVNLSSDAVRKKAPRLALGPELSQLLRDKFYFDDAGIAANVTLFDIALQKCDDLFDFLYMIAPKALRADNVQGYVVGAVRKHLKESAGVTVEGNLIVTEPSFKGKSRSSAGRSEPTSLGDIFGAGK